jgi:hypothetical protein
MPCERKSREVPDTTSILKIYIMFNGLSKILFTFQINNRLFSMSGVTNLRANLVQKYRTN